ncbi:MAG: UDP-3-O-[3-hydroxymyristoyl] N-acetylglucosamine deacetylase [Deinococcus sp.]|nr:UDP-3-O-[3-hydroxymyristoyl] N-acetylglucosamine deacetylase [Deinococcus sp.]
MSWISGVGLHTGALVRCRLHPEPVGHGVVFRTSAGAVPARWQYVADTARCVRLAQGAAQVATVEHLLAAVAVLGAWDLTVELEGPELPILDGSAQEWAQALSTAGAPGSRRYLVLKQPVWCNQGRSWVIAVPAQEFSVAATIQFEHPAVGTQVWAGSDLKVVLDARTFGFTWEYEKLRQQGLANGASLSNVLVFDDVSPLTPPRGADEPVRHKALDLVGDLALLGGLPRANLTAICSSHRLDWQLVQAIARVT